MSTIKSSDEHLTLNADGSSKDIKFQANGVEKASISSAGLFTSTTIDATKLTGALPAISGAALTGVGVAGISSSADATAITIDSSENVGIGTTSPQKNLHIFETEGGVGAKHATIRLGGYSNVGAEISAFRIDGNSNNQGLIFSSNHQSNGLEECLKIWNNSSTGPGFTVGGAYNTNGSDKIYSCHIENNVIGHRNVARLTDAQTHWRFFNPNGQVGAISTSSSVTSFNTGSDYRLKENVDYDWDATTRLKQLKPARFNFISDATNTLVDGFIAHEVSSVVPEAITGEKDAMTAEVLYVEGDELPEGKSVGDVKTAAAIDPQCIDQSKLVPLLVKTIQELEARITALES